jgi:hypothetical protein
MFKTIKHLNIRYFIKKNRFYTLFNKNRIRFNIKEDEIKKDDRIRELENEIKEIHEKTKEMADLIKNEKKQYTIERLFNSIVDDFLIIMSIKVIIGVFFFILVLYIY